MLIELTKQIKLIRPEARAVFPYSNSLFITDEIKTMIDAGSGGRAYAAIPTEQIKLLLLTHHHFDHINGWGFFSNAQIMAGQEERWAFQDADKYDENTGYHRWLELMGSPKEEKWEKLWQLPQDVPTQPVFQPIELVGLFKDGDIFNLGVTSVQAIHTPGHSPGHYAFFFPQERILFSGDYDVSPRGPWYGYEFCDFDEIIASIHKLMALQPQILVSSHRRVITSGIEEAFLAYLEIALKRESRILDYLTEPRSISEIATLNIINEWEKRAQHTDFYEKMMIIKHLSSLQKKGSVIETEEGKYMRI